MAPAVFNAANEVAVEAFLGGRIGFLEMAEVVARALDGASGADPGSLDEVLEADREARRVAGIEADRLHREGRSGHG